MATKTMYHGELRDMGPVRVTVKSKVTPSKYSKPDAPKPDYSGRALPVQPGTMYLNPPRYSGN